VKLFIEMYYLLQKLLVSELFSPVSSTQLLPSEVINVSK